MPTIVFDESDVTHRLCIEMPQCIFGLMLIRDIIVFANWIIHNTNVNSFVVKWMYRSIISSSYPACINSLSPRPNRRHFADAIFKCIYENKNEWISPRILLKFVPKLRINNITALVQIMAWRRPGDKPLSEPMMLSLPTHICVTQPQWVKYCYINDCDNTAAVHI